MALPVMRDDPNASELAALARSAGDVGTATHRLVGLAALLSPQPSWALIVWLAERHVGLRKRGTSRQALLMATTTFANVYFRHYAWPASQLAAVEDTHGSSRLDLLWRRADGSLVADELKTGRPDRDGAAEQAHSQARAARDSLGAPFAGVRVVFLRTAGDSTFYPAPERWPV